MLATLTLLSEGREITCRNPIYRHRIAGHARGANATEGRPATITAETSIDAIAPEPKVRTPHGDFAVEPELHIVRRRIVLNGTNIPQIAASLGLL